jgi:hypothetical protein
MISEEARYKILQVNKMHSEVVQLEPLHLSSNISSNYQSILKINTILMQLEDLKAKTQKKELDLVQVHRKDQPLQDHNYNKSQIIHLTHWAYYKVLLMDHRDLIQVNKVKLYYLFLTLNKGSGS